MDASTCPIRTRMTINRLVHDVGTHAGMPELTPRTLRHTFLRILADKTHDIDDVMRYGGCSLAVAVGYVRTADSERDKAFFDGRLLANREGGIGRFPQTCISRPIIQLFQS